jgi:hypothetical protein
MSKSNLKVVKPSECLSGAQLERIAEGLALALCQDGKNLEGLFLLMQEVSRNCHDWAHLDNLGNTVSRHLIIYMDEFDEAEQKAYQRLSAEVASNG